LLQSTYLPQTEQLLQNPAAPTSLYSTSLLTGYINTARGQVAGEGKCIRSVATLSTVIGQQVYPFSSLNLGTSSVTGISGAINVSGVWAQVGSGQAWLQPRNWEWFSFYYYNNVTPVQALPTIWSQYGQGASPPGSPAGSSFGGSLYVYPIPDQVYTLYCDCTCYPIQLAADTDVEAIPYLWTDAVPFFAAYYALLSAQTNARMQDAQRYFEMYKMFLQRARDAANPLQLGNLYQQAKDPIQVVKIQGGASGPPQ
jgi:hypothetical protein